MKRFRMEEEGEVEGSTDVANLLMLLSSSSSSEASDGPQHPRRLFRCKSCSRQFPSFQALGGHRASHKKPRLGDGDHAQQPAAPPKPRAHACSICGLEFPMGQALGGHMRRHRAPGGASPLVLTEKKPGGAGEKKGELGLDLDLKLAPLDKDDDLCTLRLGLGLSMAGYLYSPKSLCFATV